jgi:hypothetical protein
LSHHDQRSRRYRTVTPRKLFSLGQIHWQHFLGAPIAGSSLVAWNYQVLLKASAPWQSIVDGLISTIILFVIAFFASREVSQHCFAARLLFCYAPTGRVLAVTISPVTSRPAATKALG